jgi:hypothetical protein
LTGALLLREPTEPKERLMSKMEKGHPLSREPLNAMSEGENAQMRACCGTPAAS